MAFRGLSLPRPGSARRSEGWLSLVRAVLPQDRKDRMTAITVIAIYSKIASIVSAGKYFRKLKFTERRGRRDFTTSLRQS